MNMYDKIQYVAYHEAGHSYVMYLTRVPFQYVTIKPESENEFGERVLGRVMQKKYISYKVVGSLSWHNPYEFAKKIREDISQTAGFITESIYRKEANYSSSIYDMESWYNNTLKDLPEPLRTIYRDFIFEYTFQVIQVDENWSNIKVIAEALLEKQTLSFDQVRNVINRYTILKNP